MCYFDICYELAALVDRDAKFFDSPPIFNGNGSLSIYNCFSRRIFRDKKPCHWRDSLKLSCANRTLRYSRSFRFQCVFETAWQTNLYVTMFGFEVETENLVTEVSSPVETLFFKSTAGILEVGIV